MAALIHPHSGESVTSQLDLFAVPTTQTSLEYGQYVEFHPVATLTDAGPLEFLISAENTNYIDLANSYLYVRASITNADGSALAENAVVAPECNFLHTLWSQCDLYMNGSLVTPSNADYAYRAYIETLLSFGKEAKESQLSSVLWYRNTSGHFDEKTDTNVGFTRRKAMAAQSSEIEMLGRLHTDLTFQNRYLLSGVEIRIRLIRAKDAFCLHGNAALNGVKVSLKDVSFFCRKIKPNPSVQLAHVKALQHGTAKYPLRRVEMKTFTVPAGNFSITKENLFLGQLPTRVVMGLVDNEAYNGLLSKSAFNFKHHNINFISLYRDGVQIPGKALQPNFAQNRFIRSYMRLFTQTGQFNRDTGNGISRDEYKDGCALFVFDLTPHLDSGDVNFELIKHGNLRLELHFESAPQRTLTVTVLAEYDNLLEIDLERRVAFDYTA